MKRILVESVKARILNESRTLACPKCLSYARIVRVKDMPEDFRCPKCKKGYLGVSAELPERIEKLAAKRNRIRSQQEERILNDLKASSTLLRIYGKPAAYVLAGRRIRAAEARPVLKRSRKVSDRLFEGIMQAERKVLRRRFL
jgi:hypothetical protein